MPCPLSIHSIQNRVGPSITELNCGEQVGRILKCLHAEQSWAFPALFNLWPCLMALPQYRLSSCCAPKPSSHIQQNFQGWKHSRSVCWARWGILMHYNVEQGVQRRQAWGSEPLLLFWNNIFEVLSKQCKLQLVVSTHECAGECASDVVDPLIILQWWFSGWGASHRSSTEWLSSCWKSESGSGLVAAHRVVRL